MNPQQIIAEVLEQLQGIWRYRWWAVGTTWLLCAAGWLYVYSIPDVFKASARVYVDTNSLLKPLMQGLTAQQNTMNEVQLVSTAVLTRPNLEAVARDTDLDLRTGSNEQFEELVTGLQRSIRVSGGRDNIFTIEFDDSNREKATEVVAAVLDTFVEDAIGAQGDDVVITERALAGEIQDHEQRLRNAESTLAAFKKENLGYMPGESGDYYSRLQAALTDVANTEEKIRQLDERRRELTRQIDGEEPVFGIMSTLGGAVTSNCSQNGQITTTKTQLAALLVDFTEKHPRVVALQETLTTLEQRCAAEAASAASSGVLALPEGGADALEINPVYQSLRVQLSNAEVELVEARGQLRNSEAAVAGLKRDVDKIAEVETQLKQLNRDYDVVQHRHQELLRRWEDLQAKNRLDPITDNVQFRRIDPPFALADPIAPNRPLFLTAVLIFALGGGGLLAFAMNQLYPVCFSRRSVQSVMGLPVLGAVSMLLTPAVRRQRRLAMVGWAASYVLLFVAAFLVIGLSSRAGDLMRLLTGGAGV